MKRKIWGTTLMVIASLTIFNSCSSSDDSDSSNNNNNNQDTTVYANPAEYVGIWELVSATSVNAESDSTINYNGEYITIINNNNYGLMQNGTFFEWKVDTATNLFWRRPGSYWLATWTTDRINESEWDFTERITSTGYLIHHNRKITEPNPAWYQGTWNVEKAYKIQKSGIDTLLSNWEGCTDVTTTELTNGQYWYEKSIKLNADGTMKYFDGTNMKWLVAGPHIWAYNTENINVDNTKWIDMIRVKEGINKNQLAFVIKIASNRAYRFILSK